MINAALEKKVAIRAAQAGAPLPAGEGEPVPSSAPAQVASNSTEPPSAAANQPATLAAPAAAIIPASTAPQQVALVRTTAAAVAASQPSRTSTYRVKRGDTLFAVARKFDTSIEELQRLNGIKGGALQVGQSLNVGNAAEVPALIKVSQPAQLSIAKPAAGKPTHYVIRPGDTLFAIANKFSVELNDLMRWNRLTARSVIQPGSKIRVSA
jgi:membrane-bound lytic murein transglycosylase D